MSRNIVRWALVAFAAFFMPMAHAIECRTLPDNIREQCAKMASPTCVLEFPGGIIGVVVKGDECIHVIPPEVIIRAFKGIIGKGWDV